MTRIAVLGLGFMGLTHLKAWSRIPGATVAAISDRDARRAAGDFTGVWSNLGDGGPPPALPGVFGTTDWQEILARPDIDVIDVCLPTPAHAEASIAALRAGKHVLCEKPLGRSVAEVRSVLDVAGSSRELFMPAMCMRFWPEWAWLKRAVDSAAYGGVMSAVFRRVGASPAGWFTDGTLSGGGILDLHVHDTDFISHLFGTPASVSSTGYSRVSGKLDHLVTHYRYPHIPLVSAEGGWCHDKSFPFTMRYTVNFERATADFDVSRKDPLLLAHDGAWSPVPCEPGDGYDHQLRYFLNCVLEKSAPRRVTGADALESTRILEAEAKSVELGTPVSL